MWHPSFKYLATSPSLLKKNKNKKENKKKKRYVFRTAYLEQTKIF